MAGKKKQNAQDPAAILAALADSGVDLAALLGAAQQQPTTPETEVFGYHILGTRGTASDFIQSRKPSARFDEKRADAMDRDAYITPGQIKALADIARKASQPLTVAQDEDGDVEVHIGTK